FLPLYAERRVHDLRVLAADEDAHRLGDAQHPDAKLDGQVVFSSGWEYGYWLNDVVAARAAWNPSMELGDVLRAFEAPGLAPALDALIADQHALLIRGEVDGAAPPTLEKRTGIAYLEGWEALQDVSTLLRQSGVAKNVS